MIEQTDELFKRFQSGDQAAYKELYDQEKPNLYLYVFRLVERNDEAEDITADALFKLWNFRKKIKSLQHVKPFLYVTAGNQSIDYLRKLRRQRLGRDFEISTEPEHNDHIFRLMLKALPDEIRKLPPQRQTVITMWLEQASFKEIAERMNLKRSTIYNHFQAALRQLEQGLKDIGEDTIVLVILLMLRNL